LSANINFPVYYSWLNAFDNGNRVSNCKVQENSLWFQLSLVFSETYLP